MKAICVHRFGDPDVMKLESVPELSPKDDQVLVEIKAAGVNPVDTYIRSGIYAKTKPLPYTPGLDGAGIILEAGPGVKDVTPGQRVFISGSVTGTYAQNAICQPDQIYPLPDTVTFSQGAALGIPYGTAHRALFGKADPQAGQTVLIHGASGGVGIAAVQLALMAGLDVMATAGTEKGRQLIADQGAKWTLDHHDSSHFEQVLELTDGRGVDIVLEMLANINLDRDLDVMAPSGTVVVIGNRGQIEIDPRKTMARDLTIRGMLLANTPPHEWAKIYRQIQEGLKKGKLNPVIAREYPLSEAAKAHQEVIDSPHYGKWVLIP